MNQLPPESEQEPEATGSVPDRAGEAAQPKAATPASAAGAPIAGTGADLPSPWIAPGAEAPRAQSPVQSHVAQPQSFQQQAAPPFEQQTPLPRPGQAAAFPGQSAYPANPSYPSYPAQSAAQQTPFAAPTAPYGSVQQQPAQQFVAPVPTVPAIVYPHGFGQAPGQQPYAGPPIPPPPSQYPAWYPYAGGALAGPPPKKRIPAWGWWTLGGGLAFLAIVVVAIIVVVSAFTVPQNPEAGSGDPGGTSGSSSSPAPPVMTGETITLDDSPAFTGPISWSAAMPAGWGAPQSDGTEGSEYWSHTTESCYFDTYIEDTGSPGGYTSDKVFTRVRAAADRAYYEETMTAASVNENAGLVTVATSDGALLEMQLMRIEYFDEVTQADSIMLIASRGLSGSGILITSELACDNGTAIDVDSDFAGLLANVVVEVG